MSPEPSKKYESPEYFSDVLLSYALLVVFLSFLGALASWASEENNRLKLLAIAMSAPALFTTYTGGDSPETKIKEIVSASGWYFTTYAQIEWPFFISSANAQEPSVQGEPQPETQPETQTVIKDGFYGERSPSQKLSDALQFITRTGEPSYWVVVGSSLTSELAQKQAEKINQVAPDLEAFVGIQSDNGYYPVIVGTYTPYSEAKQLLEKVEKIDFLKAQGPFLSK